MFRLDIIAHNKLTPEKPERNQMAQAIKKSPLDLVLRSIIYTLFDKATSLKSFTPMQY